MFNSDNKIHINYSTEKAFDGTIIRSSIMVNIYENDVEAAVKLYREIRKQLEDNLGNGQAEVMDCPICPDHKVKMVLKSRRDGSGFFFGCPMFSQGCKKTAPYPIQNADIESSSVVF